MVHEFEIPVKKGDILVVGTDGLLDNMFPRDIENLAKVVSANGAEPEQVAWAIAEHAYYNSVDKHASTPSVEASLLAGKQHLGGKKNNKNVIVVLIVDK
ncbi:unnamed protein product [Ilex paraguariensis]|uniref:Protein phosphatase n=1 Tax=Ilex paraguariensis TaxID=185542 RepID=A0ABC8T134_9AQUA